MHPIIAEVSDAPLGDNPVLIRGSSHTIVGGELRQVGAEEDERVAAIAAKHQRATWIGTERIGLGAILVRDGRNERPRPYELLGCLGGRSGAAANEKMTDTAATDTVRRFMAFLP